MDGGYSSGAIRDRVLAMGRVPLIDFKADRNGAKEEMDPAGRARYGARTTVERTNSELKECFLPKALYGRGPRARFDLRLAVLLLTVKQDGQGAGSTAAGGKEERIAGRNGNDGRVQAPGRVGVRPACARRPAAGHEGYVMRPVPIPCSCQAWLLHGYASSMDIYSGIREFCKNLNSISILLVTRFFLREWNEFPFVKMIEIWEARNIYYNKSKLSKIDLCYKIKILFH
jgi:hypothetical protein